MRRSTVKISPVGAVIMTVLTCIMCVSCAYGYGGLVISVLIAALVAGVMLLSNPFIALLPAAAGAVTLLFGGYTDGAATALGAVLAAVMIYAAFRCGADLTLAGVLAGAAMLAGAAAAAVLLMREEFGSVSVGLSSLKASATDTLRQMGDTVSEAYGGEVQIYDSDIEEMVASFAMLLPGMMLMMFQFIGMLSASLSATVIRLCGAGHDVSLDGRWRCADSVNTAVVYIFAQIFLVVTQISTDGVVYYIAYNIVLTFLPAALAMGVRAMFTRRGARLGPAVRISATVFAALAMCYNPMAALQIIALTGSGAVLYRALATGWQKGMRK